MPATERHLIEEFPTAVLVSANAEWQAVLSFYHPPCQPSPYGDYFLARIGEQPVVFLHGGWGKIAAAASTQYAIQRWRPQQIINLGTCGGFAGQVQRGEILLVTRTLVYDIDEKMGDPQQALASLHHLHRPGLAASPLSPARQASLPGIPPTATSTPSDITSLHERFGAIAADWESGAIAWVARRNHVRCLILRGVTDLVSPQGGEAYGSLEFFNQAAQAVMACLLKALPAWIELARQTRPKRA